MHTTLLRNLLRSLNTASHSSTSLQWLNVSPKLWLSWATTLFVASASWAQVQLQLGANFTGSTYGVNTSLTPPDGNGAVGPAHFVEFINGRFSVYNKTNGQRVKTMTDIAFWTQAGVSVPGSWETTDPRLVYDPSVQRWFASQMDFDSSGVSLINHFLLAVSATADPTGGWKAVVIPTDPGGTHSADFPTMGLDSNGVYISGDMLDRNQNFVGASLVSIPKAGLLASTPTTNGYTSFGIMSYSARGMILQPAVCLDGSGAGSILSTGGIGIDDFGNFVTNNTLIGFEVLNAAGPGKATLTSSTTIQVPDYTAPYNPTQPPPNPEIDDGDSRLSAAVYEVQGVLYAIHSTDVDNRAALRWYRINAASHILLESGTIADPVLDLYYGSIAANTNGTVVIAFNGSSSTTYISAYAMAGLTVNGVTTFGDPVLLKSGVAAYSDGGSSSRWGDYSATSVDPLDSHRFWTIQSYASSSTRWSTQITEIVTSVPGPSLSIALSGGDIVISWPASAAGYALEATGDISAPSWAPVAQQPSYVNGQAVVQIPATADTRFFRLHSS